MPVRTTQAIGILGFVDAGEIEPIYYNGSHYLKPEELGANQRGTTRLKRRLCQYSTVHW